MSDALRDALKLCRGTLWELLVEHGRGEASFSEDMRRRVDMNLQGCNGFPAPTWRRGTLHPVFHAPAGCNAANACAP